MKPKRITSIIFATVVKARFIFLFALALGFAAIAAGEIIGQKSLNIPELIKKSEKGDSLSQYELAVAYGLGSGVEHNWKESQKWLLKSAEQGFAEAQTMAAFRYQHGIGVEKDLVVAAKWFKRAMDEGDSTATEKLFELVAEMSPEQKQKAGVNNLKPLQKLTPPTGKSVIPGLALKDMMNPETFTILSPLSS